MKKKLSAYWWCQIIGWSAYIFLATTSYLSLPGLSIDNIFFPLLVAGIIGSGITHLMRFFIIRSRLLLQNIFKQIIYLFLITISFSFMYACVLSWITGVLHWGEKLISLYTHEYKINGLLMLTYSNIFFISIWNLIYFSYHYVQKSQTEQIQKIQLESDLKIQQLESEKAQIEYQRNLGSYYLMALRYQMNPHFIFNCLNSIKLYIAQNNTATAADYLTKFSKLIRLVMENSAKGKILLSSELDMLRLYIDLEAMRFKEKLQYQIHLEKNVEPDYIELPPLLFQPYVENAIWHGLMPKEEGGRILVDVAFNSDTSILKISITDNGIGRIKSTELKSGEALKKQSYGMKVTSDRIALINQVYKSGASVIIDDLKDENNNPLGTKVIIQIPI